MPMFCRARRKAGGGQRGQRLAVHHHLAAIRALQQIDQAQQGGFAGARRADQPEDFPAWISRSLGEGR